MCGSIADLRSDAKCSRTTTPICVLSEVTACQTSTPVFRRPHRKSSNQTEVRLIAILRPLVEGGSLRQVDGLYGGDWVMFFLSLLGDCSWRRLFYAAEDSTTRVSVHTYVGGLDISSR